jgi:oligoendopeptidase F
VLNVKVRNYSNVMEPRNVSEDMENEVVDMLLNRVIENYHLFQKYIQLKAKLLNKKLPLPVEDVLAPVNQVDKKISIQEAIKTHLEVMKNFDKDFYEYSLDLLKNGRVDFMPKAGKR